MEFSPSVREYFRSKTLFITGATGYVGRFLIYKILKDLDVERIYITLRPKRGKSVAEREVEFRNLELFQFLPSCDSVNKIFALQGDILQPNLGISEEFISKLNQEVDIVFHSAASIKFNEALKVSSRIHVSGTNNVIELASNFSKLQVFVHVSSLGAWVNQNTLVESIPESPYEPLEFDQAFSKLTDEQAKKIEPNYIGKYPKFMNSYTLTKSLAEVLVERNKHRLGKVAIVRPPFLMSSSCEPKVGWFDEPQAGVGLACLYSLGLLRASHLNIYGPINVIPIDLCSNALIGVTWYVGTQHKDPSESKVFNLPLQNTISTNAADIAPFAHKFGYMFPSTKQIRPPKEPQFYIMSKKYTRVKSFFTHTLFSLMIDFILIISGRKPILYSLTRKKIAMVQQIFGVMTEYRKSWTGESKNIHLIFGPRGIMSQRDQEVFFYDLKKVDWYAVGEQSLLRFRRRVLKEPDETIPYARRRLRLLSIGYDIFKLFVLFFSTFVAYQIHLFLYYQSTGLWTIYIAALGYVLTILAIG